MSQRQTVIGFTEAELGFFLVFAMLLLFLVTRRPVFATAGPTDSVTVATHTLDSLQRQANAANTVQQQRDSLRQRLAELGDTGKRSRMTPSCKEKGLATGPLFDATVRGIDDFELGGDRLDAASIRQRFSAELARSAAAGCRHTARLFYAPGLSADMLQSGMQHLARFVYVGVAGARP